MIPCPNKSSRGRHWIPGRRTAHRTARFSLLRLGRNPFSRQRRRERLCQRRRRWRWRWAPGYRRPAGPRAPPRSPGRRPRRAGCRSAAGRSPGRCWPSTAGGRGPPPRRPPRRSGLAPPSSSPPPRPPPPCIRRRPPAAPPPASDGAPRRSRGTPAPSGDPRSAGGFRAGSASAGCTSQTSCPRRGPGSRWPSEGPGWRPLLGGRRAHQN